MFMTAVSYPDWTLTLLFLIPIVGIAIRSTSEIAAKWAEVTPQRAPQYERGVRNPKKNWEEETVKSNDAYKAGIASAIQKDSFLKGVQKAGTSKWQRGAIEKGTSRFGPGVQVAQDDYNKGFAPYREAIQNADLPPRFARRDPRNIDRVRAMVAALVEEKERQLGG